MFQKKASLQELIMGSYMVVLTFEFASLWNIRWWLFKWISFNSILTWYDLFHLQLNEVRNSCRIDFGDFWEWKVYQYTLFIQWNCLLNLLVCWTEGATKYNEEHHLLSTNTALGCMGPRMVGCWEIQWPPCRCRSKRVDFSRRRADWIRKFIS